MIRVNSLSKSFGSRQVLNELSCEFAAARVTGIVGRNGSGKSTLLNCISCRIRPDRGYIELYGQKVPIEKPWQRTRRGIVATFQEPRSTHELRLADLLAIAGVERCNSKASGAFAEILTLLDSTIIDAPLSAMSYGQRKIANLLIALAMQPRAILLDEPFAGLASAIAPTVGRMMRGLAESGLAVAVIEHDFEFLRAHCDTILLLDGGRVVLEGKPVDVLSHARLLQAFQ